MTVASALPPELDPEIADDVSDDDMIRVLARYDLRTLSAAVILLDAGRTDAAIAALLVALVEAGADAGKTCGVLRRQAVGLAVAELHDRQTSGEHVHGETGEAFNAPREIRLSRQAVAEAIAAVPNPRAMFKKLQAVHRAPCGRTRADAMLDRVR